MVGVVPDEDPLAVVAEVAGLGAQHLPGCLVRFCEQVLARQDHGVARKDQTLGGDRLPIVGIAVGVLFDGHLDLVQGETEPLGGDLGKRRRRALADLGEADVHQHAAVGVHLDDDRGGGEGRHRRRLVERCDALADFEARPRLSGLFRGVSSP